MVDVCKSNKIDSNITGLRYAEERCLKELAYESDPVAATGALTFSGTGADADTITIGARTYTLRAALSSGPTVADEVLIGANAAATAANLAAAVNGSTGVGTVYSTGTAVHADVEATQDGPVVNLEAKEGGVAGNAIATTETGTGASFGAATLTGGEDSVAVLPVFHLLEPNSYNDFGGQLATVARNPINPSRQRKKGVVTDLDASGGFEQDLTFSNLTRLLQGFFFADMREKPTTLPLSGTSMPITGVAGSTYTAADGIAAFPVGALVYASGFNVPANNGLKRVTASTGTTVVVAEALDTEATPPTTAKVEMVGFQFDAADAGLALNGDLVQLTSAAEDLTTLGLIPGEWVYLGGNASANQLSGTGFARISRIEEGLLEFDKVSWTDPAADDGTGKTLQVFFGNVLKNESDPALIKRRTYQIERTLGQDENGQMSEYLVGAVPNELTLNIPQAAMITLGLSFVAVDNEQRTGAEGLKSGERPLLATTQPETAFNSTSNVSRVKLSRVTDDAAPDALFAFATDLSLTINNNVSPNKAIGVLGAFDTTAGTFEVGGSLTAYFANVEAVKAVRENADISLDLILSQENRALLFDIPLLSLGDGRLNIGQDEPITLPLETNAAESEFGHTLLFQSFAYLPDAAF